MYRQSVTRSRAFGYTRWRSKTKRSDGFVMVYWSVGVCTWAHGFHVVDDFPPYSTVFHLRFYVTRSHQPSVASRFAVIR